MALVTHFKKGNTLCVLLVNLIGTMIHFWLAWLCMICKLSRLWLHLLFFLLSLGFKPL